MHKVVVSSPIIRIWLVAAGPRSRDVRTDNTVTRG
jgi:hypothetical protein